MENPSETNDILVHIMHWPVYALGPGKRIGLWLQGCSIHCDGCLSRDTWLFDKDMGRNIEELVLQIISITEQETTSFDGITISGGEPFDQANALLKFLKGINDRGMHDILLFSGYKAEDLLTQHPEILSLTAALVDGAFETGNETDSGWKGSDNQTMTVFRTEYGERYLQWSETKKGNLQILTNERGVSVAGIPYQKDVAKIREIISSALEKRTC